MQTIKILDGTDTEKLEKKVNEHLANVIGVCSVQFSHSDKYYALVTVYPVEGAKIPIAAKVPAPKKEAAVKAPKKAATKKASEATK